MAPSGLPHDFSTGEIERLALHHAGSKSMKSVDFHDFPVSVEMAGKLIHHHLK